jgi:hypothetical protein
MTGDNTEDHAQPHEPCPEADRGDREYHQRVDREMEKQGAEYAREVLEKKLVDYCTAKRRSLPEYALVIPKGTLDTLWAWAALGRQPGGFLTALLSNDLYAACVTADMCNRHAIWEIMKYVAEELPRLCWGDAPTVRAWRTHGGELRNTKGAG